MKNYFIKYSKWVLGIYLFTTWAAASIYQTTDAKGNLQFSDMATEHATRLHLKAANSYSAPSLNNRQTAEKAQSNTATGENARRKLMLVEPLDHQTFQNQGEISAQIQIEPSLQADESLEWWLDGKLQQQSTDTALRLADIERGEHQLQVKLTNAANQLLQATATVTFYVLYANAAERIKE